MTEPPAEPHHKVRRRRLIAGRGWRCAGSLAVLAGVYGIDASAKQSGRCGLPAGGQDRRADRAAGPWRGRGTEPWRRRRSASPTWPSRTPTGRDRTLADWRGRTVLLNLWATWCVPCRKEMPALDALEGKLGGPGFEVVAVNIDTRDPQKPLAFLKDVGVTRLAYFSDPSAHVFEDLKTAGKAFGMPTTLLDRPLRLRDRQHGGPGRMGERRRREIGERGDCRR